MFKILASTIAMIAIATPFSMMGVKKPKEEHPPIIAGNLTNQGYWQMRNAYKECASDYGNGEGCYFAAVWKVAPKHNPKDMAKKIIAFDAKRHNIPQVIALSVAKNESAFKVAAVSHVGAQGLMQVMPFWGKQLKLDLKNPFENSEAGVRILRHYHKVAHGNWYKAIGMYNGGGACVTSNGVPTCNETKNYVAGIMNDVLASAEVE